METKIPFLKKESKIVVGSIAVQELQACITVLMETVDQEELRKKIENKDLNNLSPIEKVICQLLNLVQQIFKEAEIKGDLIYKDIEDSISSSISV